MEAPSGDILGRSLRAGDEMGQAILYCFRCSTQLRDSTFEQGKAFRIDNFVVCAACAPDAMKSMPAESVQKLQDMISGKDARQSQGAAKRKTGYALPSVKESIRDSNRIPSVTGSSSRSMPTAG